MTGTWKTTTKEKNDKKKNLNNDRDVSLNMKDNLKERENDGKWENDSEKAEIKYERQHLEGREEH